MLGDKLWTAWEDRTFFHHDREDLENPQLLVACDVDDIGGHTDPRACRLGLEALAYEACGLTNCEVRIVEEGAT